MILANKIELRPTRDQAIYLSQAIGIRRHCYNQFVDHFSLPWNDYNNTNVKYLLRALKIEFPWYYNVSSRITLNTWRDFDQGIKGFFRRVKKGNCKPGFPKFKKKGFRDSCRFDQGISVKSRLLKLERLDSCIKMREKLRFQGSVKQVIISKVLGKYYASIIIDAIDYDKRNLNRKSSVGVDFGIKNLAILSDGKVFGPSNKLRKSLVKLRKLSKNLSRKKRGSNNRTRAKFKLGRYYQRVSRQRSAFLHNISDYITRNYDRIVIEDLHVKGMVKNHNLALSISDASFGMLRSQITYKSKLRDNDLIIADRWFPSSKKCSSCGNKKKVLSLSERIYSCDCGLSIDRDLNAAINLNNYSPDICKPDSKCVKELGKSRVLL